MTALSPKPASAQVSRARCIGLQSTSRNAFSASTAPIRAVTRRPCSVRGMSVVPVCCPLRLHAVSPCLIANRFTLSPTPSGRRPTSCQCSRCHNSSSGSSLRAARHLRQVSQPFERACRQHLLRATPPPVSLGPAGNVHPGLVAQVEQVLKRRDRERGHGFPRQLHQRWRHLGCGASGAPEIAPHVLLLLVRQ